MKKIYYLAQCGTGTSVHYRLLDLVKEENNNLLFHINDFDWDTSKERIITLKAKKITRKDCNGNDYETIYFHSSKKQYQFCFIKEMEIDNDVEPQSNFITL